MIVESLAIFLLGGFHVEANDEPITAFESNKVRALLAYLAVEADQPHRRTTLAGLLWPDHPETMARTNLRHVLRQLRHSLPVATTTSSFLFTSKNTLQFNPAAGLTVDVTRFTRLLTDCARCKHRTSRACAACMSRYQQAAALYKGDFLASFSLQDSSRFEEWAVIQRESLHRQALELCFTLAAAHEEQGDYEQAQHYARRQIELEPWREEAHRQLMRVLARSGQRTAALAQFAHCCQLLADELAVEPAPETITLYEQIRLDQFHAERGEEASTVTQNTAIPDSTLTNVPSTMTFSSEPAHSRTPSQQEWENAPAISYFYGRTAELEQLKRWLLGDRCRLVTVLAMGGMGKTTLAAKVARLLADEFEFVLWRSLLNAPPLQELLRDILRFLARQQLDQLPTTLGDQLTLLLTCLRQHRCLLVLDNVESILAAGQAGHYRAGYEGYGQLLDRVVQREHQSCLLLTSRERPRGVEQFEEDFPWVRSLPLEGLGATAGHALLKTRGVADQADLAHAVVQRYSGNPLALKLVARTIQDLFDGDIAAFLRDEAPIFDDIRTVLDQQFQRLTPLEREILIWLAVEREAISLQTLTGNLVQPPARRDLLEALRALQHRSLLEKTEVGFTLQNVVTEYVTDYVVAQVCVEIAERRPPHVTAVSTRQPDHFVDQFLLHRHALLKAHSKEYIRQSQRRLLLAPICHCLEAALGRTGLSTRLQTLLDQFRIQAPRLPSYAGGNILNLLLQLQVELQGWNFSRLAVWQAFLQGMNLQGVDFTAADFTGSSFTETFGVIHTVAYSPDGEWLAAGTMDGEVWLWRAAAIQPVRVIRAHTGPVRAVVFHPNSKTVATGGDDHTVRLWETASGRALHTLLGHNGWVRAVAFSPDGRLVVGGSMDGTVCLWETAGGKVQQILREHTNAVWAIAFHPSLGMRPLLASCSADATVRLWDANSGQALCTLTDHTWEVRCLAFSPDGKLLASGGLDKRICLWAIEAASGGGVLRQTLIGDKTAVRCLTFSPDSTTLASGGADAAVRLWDTATGQIRHTLYGHEKGINTLAFAPDGATLMSGCDDRTIRIWNPQNGQPRDTLHGHTGWVRVVAFRPHSAQAANELHPLVASGSDDTVVRLWDADTGERLHALRGHHHWIWSMAFSPDGEILATGGADHLLCLWDVKEPAKQPQLRHRLQQHTNTIRALAFSPGGELLASGDADEIIYLWNPQTGQLLQTLQGHTGWVNTLAFSPDGTLLASAGNDRTIRLWRVDTRQAASPERGQAQHTLVGHTDSIGSVLFNPDGTCLVSAGRDDTIYLWNLPALLSGADQKQPPQLLAGHTKEIHAIAYSPDGLLLASASSDQTVRLWDGHSGQALTVLDEHTAWVSSVAFAPGNPSGTKGHLLASAGADQTIRLWDVQGAGGHNRLCHVLHGHEHWIWRIAFSPNGELLASASVDKTVKLWDTRTGVCRFTLRPPGPYTGMKITGVTGISEAQKAALRALGAVEE